MRWSKGETAVAWVDGGLWVQHRQHGLLIDAPPGVVAALGDRLSRLRAVLLTSGRMHSVGGLIPLLDALAPHRAGGASLEVHTVLGEERGVALAETWSRAWSGPYALVHDAERPGAVVDVGAVEVTLLPMKSGEPDWRGRTVRSRAQVAARVQTPDAIVAWVVGAAPGTAVHRACAGANLAIVEAGVQPWPATEIRWRLTPGEAWKAASEADAAWVFGDDGRAIEEVTQ